MEAGFDTVVIEARATGKNKRSSENYNFCALKDKNSIKIICRDDILFSLHHPYDEKSGEYVVIKTDVKNGDLIQFSAKFMESVYVYGLRPIDGKSIISEDERIFIKIEANDTISK